MQLNMAITIITTIYGYRENMVIQKYFGKITLWSNHSDWKFKLVFFFIVEMSLLGGIDIVIKPSCYEVLICHLQEF